VPKSVNNLSAGGIFSVVHDPASKKKPKLLGIYLIYSSKRMEKHKIISKEIKLNMDDSIVRILIATDNHLGFLEKDTVRGDDSFAAFEEVLRNAKTTKADFVLLAGDMFHENKPSRKTMHATMELLKKYCYGDEPVFTEILNEQSDVFKTKSGKVNYEDPYASVSLPVFGIHGNHDDPTRDGSGGDSLCAIDLLSVSNLFNYFGKADRVDDIEITPILLRKGSTFVALYGLGAIRDERLHRMWTQKKVRFIRPSEDQGRENFLNIFIVHQNRDYGRGAKNCLHESMIPEWMDIIVWGNEHECIPSLSESLIGTFRIYQPGSSVATSLSESESSSHPKSMGLLSIKSKKFKLKPILFKQLRPFLYGEISLATDCPHLDVNDVHIEDKIKQELTRKVRQMSQEAKLLSKFMNDNNKNINNGDNEMITNGNEEVDTLLIPRDYHVKRCEQSLIRLKVDHAGFPAINQQRFGAQFVGDVANPSDILVFTKKKEKFTRARATEIPHGRMQEILETGEEEEINKIRIEDLIEETLGSSTKKLSLFPIGEITQALEDFVDKMNPNAITDVVQDLLDNAQKKLVADAYLDGSGGGAVGIKDAVARLQLQDDKAEGLSASKKKSNTKKASNPIVTSIDSDGMDEDNGWHEDDSNIEVSKKGRGKGKSSPPSKSKSKLAAKTTTKALNIPSTASSSRSQSSRKSSKQKNDSDHDIEEIGDDEDGGVVEVSNKSSSSGRRTSRTAALKKKIYVDNSDSDNNQYSDDGSDVVEDLDDDEDGDDEIVITKGKRGGNGKSITSTKPTKKAISSRNKKINNDSDDDVEMISEPISSSKKGKRQLPQTQENNKFSQMTKSQPAKRANFVTLSNDWD
jgi:double-strand break repair protein MRE11